MLARRSTVGAPGTVLWGAVGVVGVLNVLLVEQQEVVRRGLVAMLHGVSTVADVVSTASLSEAEEIAAATGVDLLVLASRLTPAPTPELVHRVRGDALLLVLLSSVDAAGAVAAAELHADGFALTSELTQQSLEDALVRMQSGDVPMPRAVAKLLLTQSNGDAGVVAARLTAREEDVLRLIVSGLSNKEIALELQISVHGAKRHVSNVIGKLHCATRTQVAARALRAGIVEHVAVG